METTVGNSSGDWYSLKTLIKHSLVEKFLQGSERPCDNNDFLNSQKSREKLTTDIRVLVENLANCYSHDRKEETKTTRDYPAIENEILAGLLILCGQNLTLHPWNTETIVKNCRVILSQILKLFSCKDTEMILRNCKINLTKDILQILCADLTASEWKYFPASVTSYKWILEMIKQPNLSQYLQFILPPALLLTDDFINENRITGAQCLNHIVQNITIAELQLCGHGDVIYNALIPILRVREADLIHSAITPLVYLTEKLEFNLGKKNFTKWSKFDDILEIFLENMELEQIMDLRNCYISNLNLLISTVGNGVIRWSKRLLRIFDEFITTAGKYKDEKTTSECLKTMETFIKFSSKVTPLHAKHLLFTLLIALHSTSSCSSELQRESKQIAIKCIKTILGSLPETEKDNLKRDLQENLSSNVNFLKFYEQVLDIF